MLYTFKDIELTAKQVLPFALKRVYGIGLPRAIQICSVMGLSSDSRVGFLNPYVFFILTSLIKQHYGTDVFLKRMRENNLKLFLASKSYRSIRLSAGLPIRGQHTHNNARTAKSLRYIARKP